MIDRLQEPTRRYARDWDYEPLTETYRGFDIVNHHEEWKHKQGFGFSIGDGPDMRTFGTLEEAKQWVNDYYDGTETES